MTEKNINFREALKKHICLRLRIHSMIFGLVANTSLKSAKRQTDKLKCHEVHILDAEHFHITARAVIVIDADFRIMRQFQLANNKIREITEREDKVEIVVCESFTKIFRRAIRNDKVFHREKIKNWKKSPERDYFFDIYSDKIFYNCQIIMIVSLNKKISQKKFERF